MNSYQLISFHEQSALPLTTPTDASTRGSCLYNVDGRCIMGGQSILGSRGYRTASMGMGGSAVLTQEDINQKMGVGAGYPTPADVMSEEGVPRKNSAEAMCVGFPLFAAQGRPYELYGIETATLANKLKGISPYYAMS